MLGKMAISRRSTLTPSAAIMEANYRLCRWFGVVLLPLISFAGDGVVAIIFFIRYSLRLFFGKPPPPVELAKARAIDMSVQFLLFWMPFLVLLGWWSGRPMHMLFGM
jgi:Ca2+:H+ antiporter